jgi:hypothetical protein
METKLTQKTVRAALSRVGISFRKTDCGEYRVNFRNGREETAYYTDDLSDALNTGIAMLNPAQLSAQRVTN